MMELTAEVNQLDIHIQKVVGFFYCHASFCSHIDPVRRLLLFHTNLSFAINSQCLMDRSVAYALCQSVCSKLIVKRLRTLSAWVTCILNRLVEG